MRAKLFFQSTQVLETLSRSALYFIGEIGEVF